MSEAIIIAFWVACILTIAVSLTWARRQALAERHSIERGATESELRWSAWSDSVGRLSTKEREVQRIRAAALDSSVFSEPALTPLWVGATERDFFLYADNERFIAATNEALAPLIRARNADILRLAVKVGALEPETVEVYPWGDHDPRTIITHYTER